MKYSHLLRLVREAGISPEKAAEYMGISGMTLRRWRARPSGAELPGFYCDAAVRMAHRLIAEGRIAADSETALAVLAHGQPAVFGHSVDRTLGLPPDFLSKAANNSDILVAGLSQIGAKPENRRKVHGSIVKILSFQSWGESWKRCISGTMKVIRSRKLTLVDKLVAYGALFYLIMPFDLIPDAIPGIGYLDDFAILSLAVMYYERRFRHLFEA